jgi:AbiV family abortive infection protein
MPKSKSQVTNVSEQTLLEGSWFALEQAGRFLCSATQLFRTGDWSTALAIAMFGREELGRSRLLRDISGEVHLGKVLGPAAINRRCKRHAAKQDASAFSVTVHAASTATASALDAAVTAKARRQSSDRHEARCSSL